MQERTYLGALLHGKCPACRQGDMFVYPLRRIGKFNVMHDKCPHCDVRLEPEPGFYQGAMYVGYGITIGCIMAISAILYLLNTSSEWTYIGTIIAFMVLIAPLNYRYSRIIYLYLFGGLTFKK